MLLTSQLTVVVVLTEAVALSPSLPTMAVSTYCMRVPIICSAILGIERLIMDFSTSVYSF
jgi:hypothetical protein